MAELIPVLSRNALNKKITDVAQNIDSDYQNSELILVGVLKGAFVFLSELLKYLTLPVKVDFVGTASYGNNTSSSGNIQLTKKLEIDIKNKHVLIVEDIVDTGLTVDYIVDYLNAFKPEDIRLCVLLDKKERRQSKIKVDYCCHVVQNGFFVGYGLDYAESYRNLQGIYRLKINKKDIL